jgi:hypothetical protein
MFLSTSGLLIWIADFGFIYVFAAVACARRFTDVQFAGVSIVPLVTTAVTMLSAAVTAVLVRFAIKRRSNSGLDEHGRFLYFVVLATSGIAIVAMLWLLLPSLAMHACSEGSG